MVHDDGNTISINSGMPSWDILEPQGPTTSQQEVVSLNNIISSNPQAAGVSRSRPAE